MNGPSILSKYVGQAEENIRELFADAAAEQAEMGDESELHIIIFDEMDAICRQRGSGGDGTGTRDSAVNQLLSMIDGVNSLNNILVIGMANRKELIDEALLRAGRFEVHVEIGLPKDSQGRLEILRIHTQSMKENGLLEPALVQDLFGSSDSRSESASESESSGVSKDSDATSTGTVASTLAEASGNFTPAEIAGVIRDAAGHAFARGFGSPADGDFGTAISISDPSALCDFKPCVQLQDMRIALQNAHPLFGNKGAEDEELREHFAAGLVPYGKSFVELNQKLEGMVEYVRMSSASAASAAASSAASSAASTSSAVCASSSKRRQ